MKLRWSLIFMFFLCCCAKVTKKPSEVVDQNSPYQLAELLLCRDKEKIALLSAANNVPYDTLFLILKEYYAHYPFAALMDDSSAIQSQKTIANISTDFGFSKAKVASLIFSFKYEMLTKEEIKNDYIKHKGEEERADYQDDYDPRF